MSEKKEKKCKIRKSVSIDLAAYETLQKIKDDMVKKMGGREIPTYFELITSHSDGPPQYDKDIHWEKNY